MKLKYTNVIWDWNGTLLDDVDWSFKNINTMLSRRGMRLLGDVLDYRSVFCFPIIEYYRNIGFDFSNEPFEVLAEEFVELYSVNNYGCCELFPNTLTILDTLKNASVSQVVLSASSMDLLSSQMSELDIIGYFDEVLGLTDIYAASKIDIGLEYIKRMRITNAVMIGDSKHDYEVAQALGVDCILISNGHQGREALLSCGVPVLDDITDVIDV